MALPQLRKSPGPPRNSKQVSRGKYLHFATVQQSRYCPTACCGRAQHLTDVGVYADGLRLDVTRRSGFPEADAQFPVQHLPIGAKAQEALVDEAPEGVEYQPT